MIALRSRAPSLPLCSLVCVKTIDVFSISPSPARGSSFSVVLSLPTSQNTGTNEVSIFGLTSKVDKNSVRVAGGKGAAIILEVYILYYSLLLPAELHTSLGVLQHEV